MKRTALALLSAALLTMVGVTESSAQEENRGDTIGIEQQRIGEWIFTREYTITRDDDDGYYEKESVNYNISFGNGFSAHLPFYYMGLSNFFVNGPFSMQFSDIPIDEAKSWEWGIYLPLRTVRLGSDHVGLGFSFGFGRAMYKFNEPSYFFTMHDLSGGRQNRQTLFASPNPNPYDETWFRYWSLKLPIQLEYQTSSDGFFVAVGPEIEYRFSPASRGRQQGHRKETITTNISMLPLNVNLLAQVGFDNISFMAKTSLVELFAASTRSTLFSNQTATQVWPVSVCIGLTF